MFITVYFNQSLEMEELYHPPSGHSIPAAPCKPSKAEMRALRSSRSPPRAPPNSPCSWSVTFSALDPVALYTSLDVNSDTSARIRKPSNCTGNRGTIKRKQLSRGSNEDDDECILLGIYPPKDSFPTRNHFTKTLRTTEEICLDLPEVSIVSYSTNTLSSTKHQAALATSPTEEEICLDLPVVSILSSAPSSDGNFPPNISTALAQVTHLETGANNEGACLGDYQVSTINFMKKINAIMEGKGFPEECFNALQKFYETVQAFLKKNQDPLWSNGSGIHGTGRSLTSAETIEIQYFYGSNAPRTAVFDIIDYEIVFVTTHTLLDFFFYFISLSFIVG